MSSLSLLAPTGALVFIDPDLISQSSLAVRFTAKSGGWMDGWNDLGELNFHWEDGSPGAQMPKFMMKHVKGTAENFWDIFHLLLWPQRSLLWRPCLRSELGLCQSPHYIQSPVKKKGFFMVHLENSEGKFFLGHPVYIYRVSRKNFPSEFSEKYLFFSTGPLHEILYFNLQVPSCCPSKPHLAAPRNPSAGGSSFRIIWQSIPETSGCHFFCLHSGKG